MKRLIALISSFCLMFSSTPAFCWDLNGHQTVALIAQSRLTPEASAVIARLLAQEPGSTLVSIASWADEYRDSSNTRWHYVNFPRDNCHYQAARDCPDGECVVAKIDSFNAVLHSNASDASKLEALKFLVHLVGDIHQPLHAGFGYDKGGNLYQIQYQNDGTNLHALWDTAMVEQFQESPKQLAETITSNYANAVSGITLDGGPAMWAEQSCTIVAATGFYPRHNVTQKYLQHFAPLAQLQLLRAGVRLADLLNTLH